MLEFQCNLLSPPFQVKVMDHLDLTEQELLTFVPFVNWTTNLQASLELQATESHPFKDSFFSLRSITIQSLDRWTPTRIGFLKMAADIWNESGDKLPGIVLLKGASVAILIILRPSDSKNERWVIVTKQPRIPAGHLQYGGIPGGIVDDEGDLAGAAAKEVREKMQLGVRPGELINLTALASDKSRDEKPREVPREAMYSSPDSTDETITIFLWEFVVERNIMDDLRRKLEPFKTPEGKKSMHGMIKYEDLWKFGVRDSKTIAAWALYEGLKKTKHPGLRGNKLAESRRFVPG